MSIDHKPDKAPEVHTEVHPQGAAWPDEAADMDAAELAAKDKASSADDALDGLFTICQFDPIPRHLRMAGAGV
jgi:hypothetical protein